MLPSYDDVSRRVLAGGFYVLCLKVDDSRIVGCVGLIVVRQFAVIAR